MLSLYRRHRPKAFDEVVGQESVVRTLRNAIELGKVHHAYLFVGSRGTGKTSMAKLLACALNAEGGPRTDFSPDDPACRAIMNGTSLDVVEMDAASNNSVDDIRELRESVALAPMGGGRRIYILDEAHMLSTAAWNAFLKTLEEPPAHAVFVLATTEAHKVPATIVDRCHRFTFGRPSLEQIAGVIRRVADEEQISIPDAAVGMIARKAAGSFRDALGTLEQLVTYGGSEVALEDVLETLGVASPELVLGAAEALAESDARAALLLVQRIAESGLEPEQLMRDLAAHLRHLFVLQTLGEVPDSFAPTAEHADRLVAQAKRLSKATVIRAIDLLAAALAASKEGSEPRLQLEVALLKATQPEADQSLQALLFRIDRLEARLGGAAATGAAQPGGGEAGGPASRGAAGGPPGGPPPEPDEPERSSADRSATASAAAVTAAMAAGGPGAGSATGFDGQPGGDSVAVATAVEARPGGDSVAVATAVEARQGAEPVAVATAVEALQGSEPVAVAAALDSRTGAEAVAVATAVEADHDHDPVEGAPLDLGRVKELWAAVADAVREQNAMVAALLGGAVPAALDGDRLTVAFPHEAAFLKKKAEANRELVLGAVRSLTGRALAVSFELSDRRPDEAPRTMGEDELIEALKRELGAEEVFDEGEDSKDSASVPNPSRDPRDSASMPSPSPLEPGGGDGA